MKIYQEIKTNSIVFVTQGEIESKDFKELIANTEEAAIEKHIPVISYEDDKMIVTVGSIEHPMTEEHYITCIALVNEDNIIIKKLKPIDKPIATFPKVENAKIYAYCNLHGLWQSK